ncbi:hypothetical protein AAC432_04870 [Lactobacillus jensenii]|uniref:hypothetical protein n=1 Tax=Lactobacillus jensenii TaxID=109790 RepID=UPI00311D4B22
MNECYNLYNFMKSSNTKEISITTYRKKRQRLHNNDPKHFRLLSQSEELVIFQYVTSRKFTLLKHRYKKNKITNVVENTYYLSQNLS